METWISLPRNRRPKEWDKYEDPVCLLRLNLYGHPLAGLFWEMRSTNILLSSGFEKITQRECLFVHRKEQLFLSVYVDDYKMAGNAENVKTMWEKLRTKIDLDDDLPLHDTVYLGNKQYEIEPHILVHREFLPIAYSLLNLRSCIV